MISCFCSRASGTRSSEHERLLICSFYDRRRVADRPGWGKWSRGPDPACLAPTRVRAACQPEERARVGRPARGPVSSRFTPRANRDDGGSPTTTRPLAATPRSRIGNQRAGRRRSRGADHPPASAQRMQGRHLRAPEPTLSRVATHQWPEPGPNADPVAR